MTRPPRLLALAFALLALFLTGLPALAAPGETYVGPHQGDGNLPAGCIADTNPANPDNECFHMKVGLNALDSPKIDVAVLVPVSPTAERDLRLMKQVVHMWEGGIHYLSGQMDLPWLRDGVDFRVTGEAVPVEPDGSTTKVINLVDPEIVVVATNPVGGIGIGIDPANFVSQIGISDGEGAPCMEIPAPTDMATWEAKEGYDGHHGDDGGIYVEDCNGSAGGNVCFAINGAIDPLPGQTDLFGIFDLISHEFGHCLTLGHVGDGADGPWGPTPTNDIMAYSTDPPGVSKCVSTLDVEGFALRMSHYLDVNGDDKVTKADVIEPNDVAGDGANSYQVQHPDDHHYASATGDPADCPQPDSGFAPGAVTDWTPKPVVTTRPVLRAPELAISRDGRITAVGTAERVPTGRQPTKRSGATDDTAGDADTPVTDLTGVKVEVTAKAVEAVLQLGQVNPLTDGASLTAYSLLVSGRRFDSFIANGTTDRTPTTLDNGSGVAMPPGTSTWDADTNTVRFRIPRGYLADQQIRAPYDVSGQTGYHARSNDWLLTDDLAPDKGGIGVAGPAMDRGPSPDAPVADKVTSRTVKLEHEGGNTFTPADTTAGVGLSPVDTRHRLPLAIAKQSTVEVTLTWDDPASFLGLHVSGGNAEITKDGDRSVTVTVPWARRDLVVTVDPEEILGPVTYTLKARMTTVVEDSDGDRVPDVADNCRKAPGPAAGAGCPDTDRDGTFDRADRCPREAGTGPHGCPAPGDERVVLIVDGERVDAQSVMTRHGGYRFALGGPVGRGGHDVRIVWYAGGKVVAALEQRLERRLG